eukprot:NODE_1833_length_723_cov_38.520134_g1783_i0.p1 GENE.NODE_1833_length_723_cov_38.520134_g1783_i0~~NODE_1833_length_723_cov_38.520134_g1783_i0.p1  ORF type:complete len:200 (+),score=53.15 NODE_1833_length_723_cov_38.520134_g1783_i0:68-667(+)
MYTAPGVPYNLAEGDFVNPYANKLFQGQIQGKEDHRLASEGRLLEAQQRHAGMVSQECGRGNFTIHPDVRVHNQLQQEQFRKNALLQFQHPDQLSNFLIAQKYRGQKKPLTVAQVTGLDKTASNLWREREGYAAQPTAQFGPGGALMGPTGPPAATPAVAGFANYNPSFTATAAPFGFGAPTVVGGALPMAGATYTTPF